MTDTVLRDLGFTTHEWDQVSFSWGSYYQCRHCGAEMRSEEDLELRNQVCPALDESEVAEVLTRDDVQKMMRSLREEGARTVRGILLASALGLAAWVALFASAYIVFRMVTQ